MVKQNNIPIGIMFAVGYNFFRCLKEGLNHKTATIWYSDSVNLFPELTERFRPANLSKWIDFKFAIKADLEAYEKPYYRFPVFSDKVLVFNLPKEDLMKLYWACMRTLDEFLKNKPYNNPELYIFEQVPAKLINYIE